MKSTKQLVADLRTLEVSRRAILDELRTRYEKNPLKCGECGRPMSWGNTSSTGWIDADGNPACPCDCMEDMK